MARLYLYSTPAEIVFQIFASKNPEQVGNFVNPAIPDEEEGQHQQIPPINYVYIYKEENAGSEKDSD